MTQLKDFVARFLSNYKEKKKGNANYSSFAQSLDMVNKYADIFPRDIIVDISCFRNHSPKTLQALVSALSIPETQSELLGELLKTRLADRESDELPLSVLIRFLFVYSKQFAHYYEETFVGTLRTDLSKLLLRHKGIISCQFLLAMQQNGSANDFVNAYECLRMNLLFSARYVHREEVYVKVLTMLAVKSPERLKAFVAVFKLLAPFIFKHSGTVATDNLNQLLLQTMHHPAPELLTEYFLQKVVAKAFANKEGEPSLNALLDLTPPSPSPSTTSASASEQQAEAVSSEDSASSNSSNSSTSQPVFRARCLDVAALNEMRAEEEDAPVHFAFTLSRAQLSQAGASDDVDSPAQAQVPASGKKAILSDYLSL